MEPALIIGVFLVSVAQVFVGTAVPMFLSQHFHAGPFVIGLASALNQFAYLGTTLLFGFVLRPRFPFFLLAPLAFTLIFFLLPSLPLTAFIALYAAGGILYARYWAPIQDCFRGSRPAAVNNYNLSFTSGILLGTFGAGLLYEANRLLPFHAAVWIAAPVALLFLAMSRNILKIRAKRQARAAVGRRAFPKARAWRIRTLFFLQSGTYGVLISTYPKLCLDRPDRPFTPAVIAGLVAFYYAVRLAAFFGMRRLGITENRPLFTAACLVTGAGICLMPLAPGIPWQAAAMVLAAVPTSLAYHNSFHFHLEAGLPTELHQAIISAGALFSAFATGSVGEILGLERAFLLQGAFVAAAGIAAGFLLRDRDGEVVSTARTC